MSSLNQLSPFKYEALNEDRQHRLADLILHKGWQFQTACSFLNVEFRQAKKWARKNHPELLAKKNDLDEYHKKSAYNGPTVGASI